MTQKYLFSMKGFVDLESFCHRTTTNIFKLCNAFIFAYTDPVDCCSRSWLYKTPNKKKLKPAFIKHFSTPFKTCATVGLNFLKTLHLIPLGIKGDILELLSSAQW